MSVLATRARGLGSRLAPPEVLGAIERAEDRRALAAACAAAGLAGDGSTSAIEDGLRTRTTAELAILDRWATGDALAPLVLDHDRRTLRALVRGLAANVPPNQRLAGAVPTRSLPVRTLAAVANATSIVNMARALGDHPFAAALASDDPLEVELALARAYFARTKRVRGALAIHIAQLVDVENATTALLLATRGGELAPESCFIDGGTLLGRAAFLTACASLDAAREQLGRAFAGTPIATALYAPDPAAIEDAALGWHLATQARLRRLDPLGLAAVIYFVLRRRAEMRRIRRAAWRVAFGGAA